MDLIDASVDRLTKELPIAELSQLVREFSYGGGDSLLDLGLPYRTQGYLTLEQAYVIVEWKAPTKKRDVLRRKHRFRSQATHP